MRKFIIIFALILGICDCFAHSHNTDNNKQSITSNAVYSNSNTVTK